MYFVLRSLGQPKRSVRHRTQSIVGGLIIDDSIVDFKPHTSDYRDLDRSDYKNSVIGLSYTFVKVTENKRISLVDTNVNIVC